MLWIAVSAPLAAGGRRARSGAARGLAAVAVTSAVSNGLLKPAFRRHRPGHPEPLVPRPGLFAFPSGHSASAFAFAAAARCHVPVLAPLLGPLAGAVACSRVRTGVHHRADVPAGSAIGTAIGLAVATARTTRRPRRPALFPEAVLVTSPRIARSRDYAATRREMRRLGVAVTAQLDVRHIGQLPRAAGGSRSRSRAGGGGRRRRNGRGGLARARGHRARAWPAAAGHLQQFCPLATAGAQRPGLEPDDRLLDILTVEDVPPSRMLRRRQRTMDIRHRGTAPDWARLAPAELVHADRTGRA